MGKYLLIKLVSDFNIVTTKDTFMGDVLSTEDSLTKFKEIWDSAIESASCSINYERMIDKYDTEIDWNEFKKQL